ncbi:hypothetical protein PaeCFBP13512_18970 [Paenibacillus sp. CFBP13512]|uniref:DUF4253 domain-containing protein n=1 Tax=Paenibacillus sp. CFBP13512 TaxID=2184007 RepID=UPI0010C05622|nr:DUF4253 domain-containing protein [Paenibacillus sp. CFBP13512]TKJ87037.1 hypothetical protein PaeCFBP13512_18970 [Paenibacillus sp. CFBP13512]
MSSEILDYLQPYSALSIEAKNSSLPIQAQDSPYSLLIIPDDNIAEIMEDTLDEYDSLTDYVDQQLAQVEQMNVLDTFRTLVSHQLLYTDIADQSEQVQSMDWASLYHTYSSLWEMPLIDESLIPSKVTSLLPDLQAKSEHTDEWIQLPLPAGKEYTAPLMVPMGGFNECPVPLLQASLFQYWQTKYKAIPIVVDESMWILQAHSRPQTDQEALQLAQEHFIFCSYVLESFDSIGEYASYLQEQEFWYFWWD